MLFQIMIILASIARFRCFELLVIGTIILPLTLNLLGSEYPLPTVLSQTSMSVRALYG
jgi:hypothetical protein